MKYFNVFVLICMTVLFTSLRVSAQEKRQLDSLLTVLNGSDKIPMSDTAMSKLLSSIAYEWGYTDPDKGIDYAKRAIELAKKAEWNRGIALGKNRLAMLYWQKSDFKAALPLAMEAYGEYASMHDRNGMINSLTNLGNIYLYKSDYPDAMNSFIRALELSEAINDTKLAASMQGNIGMVYSSMGQYKKALDCYNKSLISARQTGDNRLIIRNLGSIGNVYNLQKDYKKALMYYTDCLNLCKEIGDARGISTNENNIGSVAYHNGEFEVALSHHMASLEMSRKLGDKVSIATAFTNIGLDRYFIAAGNNQPAGKKYTQRQIAAIGIARQYIDSAAGLFKLSGDLNNLMSTYINLSALDEDLGDIKSSFANYRLYTELKDSIFNSKKNHRIAELEAKHEENIREKEAALNRLEEERVENIQLAVICLFIMVLIGGVLLLSKKKVRPGVINVLSTFSVLIVFELVALLLHPHIANITHHNLILTLIALVVVASIIVPLHHRVDHWMKARLLHKKSEEVTPVAQPIEETDPAPPSNP